MKHYAGFLPGEGGVLLELLHEVSRGERFEGFFLSRLSVLLSARILCDGGSFFKLPVEQCTG